MSGIPTTVLDEQALQRLRDLDPHGRNQLFERVLAAFESSSKRLAAQLATARQSSDMQGIRLVVHTLKSSSASIGAVVLARLCAEIESSMRDKAPPELGERLDAVDRELHAVLQALLPMTEGHAAMKKATPP